MPLYEIVKAPAREAAAVARMSSPCEALRGFRCRPIDHVKLATLSELLGLGTLEEALVALDPSEEVSSEGPWVTVLPDRLLERVAGLGTWARYRVGAKWGATEEFKLDRIGPAEAKKFLVSLATLAREARAERSNLLLWSSL